MNNIIRATAYLLGGLCWFAAAMLFGFLLVQYLADGAGVQFFALSVSSSSVLFGLIRVIGLFAAAGLCFVIGVGLCAHGLVPHERTSAVRHPQLLASIRKFINRRAWRHPPEPGCRCVRCEVMLSSCIHICPACGWTQPYEKTA